MKCKHEICTMQILLIAATQQEADSLLSANPNIDVLITGAGTASTIYHLQKRIHQIDYDFIIQAGIAGSFEKNFQPGQTVLVKQDAFGDLGMEEKEVFTPLFESGFADKNEFPFKNGWLVNKNEILASEFLPSVKAITVNKVTDSLLQKQQLVNQFDPQIETMEGAAFHYTCLQEGIPFLQVRAISNYVGERNKANWKIKEAIDSLSSAIDSLIHQLTQQSK